ncbi:unnamed protein product [Urochloa decumbens]|uniref:Uncharacterized protein n=1 Tax=Urochloa decumbens TaxID=240449 RepID=A0ABC8VD87_9POAL
MSLSRAIGVISGINEFGNLFQLARSAVSYMRSQWNGSLEGKLREGDVHELQSELLRLRDTLPAMYDLIDRAEWRSHVPCVEQLLPNLKDAVYDAEDLLDEFRWYELKVQIEGNSTQLCPFIDFFQSVTQGSFNKVADIQKRLTNLSSQLEKMGLREATPRFDKSLRPVTTSFRTEPKIFGREKELEEVIRLLGVPNGSSRSSSKRKRTSNAANNQLRMSSLPVLPIVGIGGVGKTTLAQEITTLKIVKSHFDKIIWICVSDEFDVERFTKVLIRNLSGKEASTDDLDVLQQVLFDEVRKKRFLLILDDIWPDALKDYEQCWRKFCAPLTDVLQGSMLLVTTRFAEVADIVGTMESFALEGLEYDVFWDFFKLCVFGSEDYHVDPDLEMIGRSILPKLKGTPLAAKTIGRLLRNSLNTSHWNDVLNSELWQIRQKETDILPALRLSYTYLPFHLKRCFSFCAVYPKDYNFEKNELAEIWVAEGFVEPQGSIPLQHIGDQYFEDLVNLSFFQKLQGKYVMHDLIHDMAQLVSKDECFIVKNASDIKNIPQNVRHLSILVSRDIKSSDLRSLCKHTKLCTLLCNKSLRSNTPASVIDGWFSELQCLRVIRYASIKELPESIGSLKHLRYLEISRDCNFYSVPSSFYSLYNLQILYAKKCTFGTLHTGLSKLINLQKFELHLIKMEIDAAEWEKEIMFIGNFNLSIGHLVIHNLGATSKDCVAEVELRKIKYLNSLTLTWSPFRCPEHNEMEVLRALQPPNNIKSVNLNGYPGEYLPSWFRGYPGEYLPSWFRGRGEPEHIPFPNLPAVTADNNNGRFGTILRSLTELSLEGCLKLSSPEQFLQAAYMPFLEELKVSNCPMINYQRLLVPSIKKLTLGNSMNLGDNIDCSSLTVLHLSRFTAPACIELQKWSLPLLQELKISRCGSLTSIRESEHISTDLSLGFSRARHSTGKFPLLTHLSIEFCDKLESLDDLLTHECLPAIKSITIWSCHLLSMPTERLGSFPLLKDLVISQCPRLNWQSGIVFPPSLNKLHLSNCGDFSAWSPSCLENLTSLESLTVGACQGIVSIPGGLWNGSLKSVKELKIVECQDLVSIGGPEAIANINTLFIDHCPKLNEIEQPTGNQWYVYHLVAV